MNPFDLDFEPGFEADEKQVQPSFELLAHQKTALAWMQSREADYNTNIRGGFLSMLMGLGKTFTTLSLVASEVIPEGKKRPTLVVCPKTALYTWKTEIEKFFGDKYKVLVFRNDENGGVKLDSLTLEMLNSFDIVLTNYEFVRTQAETSKVVKKLAILDEADRVVGMNIPITPALKATKGAELLFSVHWHRIVADESHNFSNYKTSLWRSMMCLSGWYRWCLTGTPIRNYDSDLYSQYKWMGFQDPRFNLKTFRTKNLAAFIHYVDYEKAGIQLPTSHHHRIEIKLEGREAEIYRYYLEKAKEAFQQFIVGCKKFSHLLTLFLRLRQVCIAPYTITPQSERNHTMTEEEQDEYLRAQLSLERRHPGLVKWLHDKESTSGLMSAKITKAVELIKSIPAGEKVVVFTMFKRVIDLLNERLGGDREGNQAGGAIVIDGDVTGKMRDMSLDTFKNSRHQNVLFVSYKIGCESLNLTEANHVILMEGWWSPSTILQSKSRSHRMGQNKETHIYELFVNEVEGVADHAGLIEHRIIQICKNKEELAKSYLENGVGLKKKDEGRGLNADMIGNILGF